MKKIFVIISVLLILIVFNYDRKESILGVSYLELDERKNESIIIDVSNYYVSTKNILSLIEDLSLIEIEYSVSKIYHSLFLNLKYEFKSKNYKKELEQVEVLVSNKFKDNGYQKEVENIYFYGLRINKIKIYGDNYELKKVQERIEEFKV